MNRRSFLAGILAAGVAPAIIRLPGVLMPVRVIAAPTVYTLEQLVNSDGVSRLLWPGVKYWWGEHYRIHSEAIHWQDFYK